MHHLTLTVNPYKADHSITLNGKPVSVYSELSNFMKEPVLSWAYRFFETAEREINADFHLTVIGDSFARKFFRGLQTESCCAFTEEPLTLSAGAIERLEAAVQLGELYSIDLADCIENFPVYSQGDTGTSHPPVAFVSPEEAFLLMAQTEAQIPESFSRVTPKIAIVMDSSGDNRVIYRPDGVYLWHLDKEAQTQAVADILESFCYSGWVTRAVQLFSQAAPMLTGKDALRLQALTAVSPVIHVERIGEIHMGGSLQIPYTSYPPAFPLPEITAVPVVDGIVEVSGGTITGIREGCVDIDFFCNGEPSPFARQRIRVFRENYVQSIQVQTENLHLAVGQTGQLQIRCTPEDADDAHEIAFVAEPEGIVAVDEAGCVTALSPGQARITVKSRRVQTGIVVCVVPETTKLRLSRENIRGYVGQTFPVSVQAEPEGAELPRCRWITSDSNTAVAETAEDGSFRIRAVGVGSAVVTCLSHDGSLKAVCPVHVESTFDADAREDKRKLQFFAALGCAAIFALNGASVLQVLAAGAAAVQSLHIHEDHKAGRPWMKWSSWGAVALLIHGAVTMLFR